MSLDQPTKIIRAIDRRVRARAQAPTAGRLVRVLASISRTLQNRPVRHEDIFASRYGVRNLKDPIDGSYSGPGSTVKRTEAIREALPKLLRELEAKTFIDAPCGDLKWMQEVELPVEKYIGVDVLQELVERNQSQYGNAQRSFMHVDMVQDVLPRGDVVLNRDMLIHLSFADISKFLRLLHASGCRYLLTSHFPDQPSNRDIETGDWRPVNLEIAPFNFPPPRLTISEHYTANMDHADKCLALWEVDNVPKRL